MSLDSARSVTAARYGVTTLPGDDVGQPQAHNHRTPRRLTDGGHRAGAHGAAVTERSAGGDSGYGRARRLAQRRHLLPPGKSPATASSKQLDYFFASRGFHEGVNLRAVTSVKERGAGDQCRLIIEIRADL